MKQETKELHTKQVKELKKTKLKVKCPYCNEHPQLQLFEYSRKFVNDKKSKDKKFVEFTRWECSNCNITHPEEFWDYIKIGEFEKYIKRSKR